MRYSKIFIHSTLLFTVPSFILSPQANVYASTGAFQEKNPEILPVRDKGTPFGIPLDASLLSYDDILHFLEELENGELEKRCTLADLEQINHFLISLAREGLLSDDAEEKQILENDIQELLHGDDDEDDPYEYTLSFGHGGDYVLIPGGALYTQEGIILCKKKKKKGVCHRVWDHTKDFVKKNKKEIIIGAIVVVAAAVVIGVVVAASAAATAAGAAAASGSDNEEKNKPTPKEEELASTFAEISVESPSETLAVINEAPFEAPLLKAVMEEQISSFKESIADVVSQSTERSFGEEARDLGAHIAHEALEALSEVAGVFPQLLEEIKEISSQIGSRILPNNLIPLLSDGVSMTPMETFQEGINKGHQGIDRIFSTNQAGGYPHSQERMVEYTYGTIPSPGTFSQGTAVPKFKEIIKISEETVSVIEELKTVPRQVVQMQKPGALEKNVANTFEKFVNEKAMIESSERFKSAKTFLKPYSGEYLSETRARELIGQAGIKTFPRPSGIPENYRIKLSKKPGGMKYVDPENEGTYVRVMPGKPHSSNLSQQKPYVVQQIDGMAVDKFGNRVPAETPEAHIPLEEFVFRNN